MIGFTGNIIPSTLWKTLPFGHHFQGPITRFPQLANEIIPASPKQTRNVRGARSR